MNDKKLPIITGENGQLPLHQSSGDPIFDLAMQYGGRVTKLSQKRPLRIFWNSNAPWSISGYGNQTRLNVCRIKRGGTDIACNNFFGLEGAKLGGYLPSDLRSPEDVEALFAAIPQYPKMMDPWGVDGMIHHAKDFEADCAISLQDVWPMDMNALAQVRNFIPWVPIDHEPLPEIVKMRLKLAYRIIAMSHFGQQEMAKHGFHSTYIPHSVDTKNVIRLNKAECRKMLNIPDDIFLVGVIGANKELPSRKGFEFILRAFKKFHEKYPKSGIYFHVNLNQPGGLNILEWTDANHYNLSDCLYHIPPYEQAFKVGQDQMTRIMNCFDVLVAPSLSEGFGIPIIEAQACGVPVITNQWASMAELVEDGKTGYVIPIREKRESPLGSFFGVADEEGIYQAMEKIAIQPLDAAYIRQRIIDNYDADMVYEKYWKGFLQKLQDELVQ